MIPRRDFLMFVLALLASGLSWLGLAVERRSKPRPHPKPRPRFPGDQAYYDKKRKPDGVYFLIGYRPMLLLSRDDTRIQEADVKFAVLDDRSSWYAVGPYLFAYGEAASSDLLAQVEQEVLAVYRRCHPEWDHWVTSDGSGLSRFVYAEPHEMLLEKYPQLPSCWDEPGRPCLTLEDFWAKAIRIEV